MDNRRRLWLALIGSVLVMTVIACMSTPTPAGPAISMAGKWLDPDTSGTITTIEAQGSGYAVISVINPERNENELTQTSWSNGVLTWTYCITGGNCITSVTTGLRGDLLDTTWTSDNGGSGTTIFERQP